MFALSVPLEASGPVRCFDRDPTPGEGRGAFKRPCSSSRFCLHASRDGTALPISARAARTRVRLLHPYLSSIAALVMRSAACCWIQQIKLHPYGVRTCLVSCGGLRPSPAVLAAILVSECQAKGVSRTSPARRGIFASISSCPYPNMAFCVVYRRPAFACAPRRLAYHTSWFWPRTRPYAPGQGSLS